MNEQTSALTDLNDDTIIRIRKDIVKVYGVEAAILLAVIGDKENEVGKGEWVQYTRKEMKTDTTFNDYRQNKAVNALEPAGIIQRKRIGVPPQRYIRIMHDQLNQFIQSG